LFFFFDLDLDFFGAISSVSRARVCGHAVS